MKKEKKITNRQVDIYQSAVKRSEARHILKGIIMMYLKSCGNT